MERINDAVTNLSEVFLFVAAAIVVFASAWIVL